MFPTTIWATIHEAGREDATALEDVARRYRQPVLEYIRRRGFQGHDAEDVCQDVFLRILQGDVLAKADRQRGRFRSLLLSVTTHVIQDRLRRRREVQVDGLEPRAEPQDFDQGWVLHLTERALERLREEGSPYYQVLEGHLAGQPQDRNRLWIARSKLAAHIRREVAFTCASREDFEEEMGYLCQYLGPRRAAVDGTGARE
jgi:RNA polymerase sigma factor (sigma-70 family)